MRIPSRQEEELAYSLSKKYVDANEIASYILAAIVDQLGFELAQDDYFFRTILSNLMEQIPSLAHKEAKLLAYDLTYAEA